MGLFFKTYKEKIAIKLYNCFFTKENMILNYQIGNAKCDVVLVTRHGIFLFNIYDINGVLDLKSIDDKLRFFMPIDEGEKKDKKKKEEKEKGTLVGAKKTRPNTVPLDKNITKASIINPFEQLNLIKEEVVRTFKENNELFNINKLPIFTIPIFDNIKNKEEYDLFDIKRFKAYVKDLDLVLSNDDVNSFATILKRRGEFTPNI